MKVQDILTDEGKWTQGQNCEFDEDGNKIRFCLIGACYQAYGNEWHSVIQKIVEHTGEFASAWNDNPKRTFPEVRALIEELDI